MKNRKWLIVKTGDGFFIPKVAFGDIGGDYWPFNDGRLVKFTNFEDAQRCLFEAKADVERKEAALREEIVFEIKETR